MEDNMYSRECGEADGMVFLPGNPNQGAPADYKWLKLDALGH
jgi:hypothetical protein